MSGFAVPTIFSVKTSTESTGMARPITTMSSRSGLISGGKNWCCSSSLSIASPTTAVKSSRLAMAKSSVSFFQ